MAEFILDDYKDFKKSMYIQASAGTGKTYNITGIVSKLVNNGVPLGRILIVTYTEKAVGELRDRIRKECPDSDVDNAPIYTIHSFCQNTLSEYAFTANQCSSLSLVSETELEDFLDRQIRDVLKDNKDFEYLFASDKNQDSFIDNVKREFKAAINKYYLTSDNKEDANIISLEEPADTTIYGRAFNYDERRKILNPHRIEDLYIIPNFETNFESLENSTIQKLKDLAQNIKDTINQKKSFGFDGKTFKQNLRVIQPQIELFMYFYDVKKDLASLQEKYLSNFYLSTLPSLYCAWQQEKQKNKLQTYNDMLRDVREAVCNENSKLKEKLRQKYQYAIIDEFQDTNQLQWDIFKNVFLQKDDDSHTLIVVGDPKQSIYSFQGADVNVYNNAIEEIEEYNGGAYKLETNWRSTDSMIDACNYIFLDKSDGTNTIRFFEEGADIAFEKSDPPPKPEDKKTAPLFAGEATKPIWIAGTQNAPVTDKDFAKIAVQHIIECCTYIDGKTKLQVFRKNSDGKCHEHRNVSFKDFAVLARTSSEMKELETAMQKAGVPFLRYKDKNLFAGIECKHWIALLNAISAKDFTGRNRALLNEVLFTEFFEVPLKDVENEKYDNPSCEERQKIILWQQLAQKRKWAKLFEKIFSDSDIENKLSRLDKMQSLSKFRQIGNLSVEYLYKNDCSVEELSRYLLRLSAASNLSEDEGSLVEKGTDFDCVQVMTIHASKGLEFPVVIAAAGFKDLNTKIAKVYLYHQDKKSKLSFSENGKEEFRKEENFERERLFYVAYTRASSLLILPFYEKWNEKPSRDKPKPIYQFLQQNISQLFIQNENESPYYHQIEDNHKKETELQDAVSKILEESKIIKEKEENAFSKEKSLRTEEEQKTYSSTLTRKVPDLVLKKHSYSTLSKKKSDPEKMTENGGRSDKEGSVEKGIDLSHFDNSENPAIVGFLSNQSLTSISDSIIKAPNNYPKGTKAGKAIHEIFEKIDFKHAEQNTSPVDLEQDLDLIKDCFEKQTIKFSDEWRTYTTEFLWNTLNAALPEIKGNQLTGKHFSLNEISFDKRKSEIEFNMSSILSSENSKVLHNFFNGFIDLVFKRVIDGKEVYSILDWKSDSFEDSDYLDIAKLKKHADMDYSIQRVLYSYSLIKWLASFFTDKSEEEIFEDNFGGIYYAYVRGCKAGTSNGIFSRTWNSWKELEKSFHKIQTEYKIAD